MPSSAPLKASLGEAKATLKSSAQTFKMPDIPGMDKAQTADIATYLKDAGIPTNFNDIKASLATKKQEFKMPTITDIKEMGEAKLGNMKQTISDFKKDGVKALIPSDIKDMKSSLEETGMKPEDLFGEGPVANLIKKI